LGRGHEGGVGGHHRGGVKDFAARSAGAGSRGGEVLANLHGRDGDLGGGLLNLLIGCEPAFGGRFGDGAGDG
jgi:hypothetical protein